LPLNGLKIDRLFTEKLHNNRQTQAIVRSIVVVAQALNMEVVAEGIETLQQAQDLYSLGCTYGQGFLYSPPVSYDVAKGLLASPEPFILEVA
jgi:EAL domain-containing protein (putative c-di-GMP-specific phosphodiesterase class I)